MSHHKIEGAGTGGAGPLEEQEGLRGLVLGVLRGWDRFWFSPGAPTTLGLIRIFCGLLTLYVHLTYSWGLFSYIGAEGWVDNDLTTYLRRDYQNYAPGWDWDDPNAPLNTGEYRWSIFFHVTSPTGILVLHVASLLIMLAFTLGLWSRWTAILTWLAAMSYVQRASWTVFGLDTMMMITLAYLCIAPCGAALSLDRLIARRRARKDGAYFPPWAEPSVSANFVTRLIQVHFCLIYLAAGSSKLLGPSWWGGTAPNMVVLNYNFAPFNIGLYQAIMTFLAQHRWLWEVIMTGGVAFTIFTEIGFPFLVWDRRWRWLMVCCSVMLHVFIGVFMGLVMFSLMMLVMLLAFVPPETVRLAVERIEERFRQALADRARARAGRTRKEKLVLTR